jgi:hypothetical protein
MPSKEPDAIAMLKADHRLVEELFEKFEKATRADQKQKLALQICTELTVHTMIEEEIFYPACRGQVEDDMMDEAFVEHDGAKVLVGEIEAGSPSDEFYDAKVKVLSEQIKHHVHEEEMRSEGMFAQARDAGLDMDALAAQMKERKEEILAEIDADGLPEPKTHSLTGVHGHP